VVTQATQVLVHLAILAIRVNQVILATLVLLATLAFQVLLATLVILVPRATLEQAALAIVVIQVLV